MLNTLLLATALHAAPPADTIPGTWHIDGDVAGNPVDLVCTIRQSDAALSGSCGTAEEQPLILTGEVKEGEFSFQHTADYDGQEITIIYTGTVASPTELKGSLTVMPYDAAGVFTATRVPAPPAP